MKKGYKSRNTVGIGGEEKEESSKSTCGSGSSIRRSTSSNSSKTIVFTMAGTCNIAKEQYIDCVLQTHIY